MCITHISPATTVVMYSYSIHVCMMKFLILYTYRLEAMHDFVSKLGRDGVVREWFIEVGEGSSWGNVAPVQQMVQLENGKIH